MEFCVILPQKLNQRKKKLMNRTIIFILIWLLCMPCMAVAETSKELEEAIDKCKQECSALFDSKDTLAYGEKVHELMDLCLKADNEELYYKSWANLATFTSRHNPLKGLKVAEEMRNYAKEHDSKFGIVTALYAQANMSLKANMEERAVELCKEAIDYKNRYLPDVNCTHIYWMLAKIHLVNKRRKEALDALNKCQQEQFGDDRLLDALRQTQFENPQQVIESLKQEVEVFRTGAEPNDDLTMMCLYVS